MAQGTAVPLMIKVLGPMRVVVDGCPVTVSAGRLRVLLAVLAVSAGRSVPMDRLAAALWQDDLPGNPRRSVQTYVTRLRALLGDRAIRTRTGGYLLDVPPEAVDTRRFDRLLARADGAEDPTTRRSLLTEALRLWRGEPFEDVFSPWLAATEAPGLVERYLTAVEHCADLDLQCGRHDGLAADLTRMAARHPLRESLWVRLLVVLARCGRPAEALAQYETIRARLADELGADPGLELRRIHADLLAGVDPPLERPASAPAVPRQLPAAPSTFIGRVRELSELKRAGADVTAVSGMAGIGKTALVLHAAHQMVARFPDGQLFVDLRGHAPGMAPVQPDDALEVVLRDLGVPGDGIPRRLDERAALLRSLLAGSRVLMVLDDAAGEWQVEPLLPGTPGCHVLITSRRRLTGLDHGHALCLPALSAAESMSLLQRVVGAQRLAATARETLLEIVRLCGQLPLAIRIAAARLRAHPAWTADGLRNRLSADDRRLAELATGHRSVAVALDTSYRHLTAELRRMYRRLGLHPGADINPDTAAVLLDTSPAAAWRLLEDLSEAHLLQEPLAGRYRFPDLVRLHAASVAGEDAPTVRRAAIDRLLDYYAGAASAATDTTYRYDDASG